MKKLVGWRKNDHLVLNYFLKSLTAFDSLDLEMIELEFDFDNK